MVSVRNRPARKSEKPVNDLGFAYESASSASRYSFKAALLKLSERSRKDYWRNFLEHWRYAEYLGDTPSAIMAAAYHELDFSIAELSFTAK